MKKLEDWKGLIICLIVDIVVFVLAAVFLHTLPIKDINDRLMSFALYEFSCVMGIAAASIYGLLDQQDTSKGDHLEIIAVSLLLGIAIPVWPIVLLLVSVFTLILAILAKKKSSAS